MSDIAGAAYIQTVAAQAVRRALSTAPSPAIRHGTLQDVEYLELWSVLMDGDTDPIMGRNVSGLPLRIGQRATVMWAPKHEALIVGTPSPFSPVVGQFRSIEDFGPTSLEQTSDMVLRSVPVVAGRTYRVETTVSVSVSAAGARWDGQFRVDSTPIGRAFTTLNAQTVDPALTPAHGAAYWTAPLTTTVDFALYLDEVSGAVMITLGANSDVPRWLTVTDLGYVPTSA